MRPGRWGNPGDEVVDWIRPRRRWRNYALVPWRWRYESGSTVVVVAGAARLASVADPVPYVAAALVAVVAAAALPAVRHRVARRVRTVLTQHRLRAGMVESGVLSWSGYLPAILWARPVDGGIAVHVWCPAGVDVQTFEVNRSRLAAACWAADVEVHRHPRWGQVVVVLVVTRDVADRR